MSPEEIWWLIEAKKDARRSYGSMTESEVRELYYEAEAMGAFGPH